MISDSEFDVDEISKMNPKEFLSFLNSVKYWEFLLLSFSDYLAFDKDYPIQSARVVVYAAALNLPYDELSYSLDYYKNC